MHTVFCLIRADRHTKLKPRRINLLFGFFRTLVCCQGHWKTLAGSGTMASDTTLVKRRGSSDKNGIPMHRPSLLAPKKPSFQVSCSIDLNHLLEMKDKRIYRSKVSSWRIWTTCVLIYFHFCQWEADSVFGLFLSFPNNSAKPSPKYLCPGFAAFGSFLQFQTRSWVRKVYGGLMQAVG